MNEFHFLTTEEYENERVDKAIHEWTDDRISRTYLQKLIKDKQVLIDMVPIKASYRLKAGDMVSLNIPQTIHPTILPENIPLSVLYEDEDVIVVDKPKGMVVHPAAGHYEHTLVNALLYHCGNSLSGINGVLRPGIVHRIDKDTTGSLIVCKNDFSHREIARQLKEHSVERRYHAICYGVLKDEDGIIDAPIGRDEKDRTKMAVNLVHGKPAVTHYHVLKRFLEYTYIECRLETGRTHQIRVHMASIGHPLLGDAVYTKRKAPYHLEGQTLHAYLLGFVQPRSGEYIETVAPLPSYFTELLEKLH